MLIILFGVYYTVFYSLQQDSISSLSLLFNDKKQLKFVLVPYLLRNSRQGGVWGVGPKKKWSIPTLEYCMENIPACTNQISPDVKIQLK